MKKISRKLLMSILSMAFAVVALGTTTYAWFTMNATATASLNVNVQSGTSGVLLSTDGRSFGSTVTIEKHSNNANVSDLELKPLTYDYATKPLATTAAFKKFSSTSAEKIVAAEFSDESSYLQFDLYVCTSGANQAVYFSGANANTVTSNYATKTYTLLNGFNFDGGSFTGGTTVKVDAVNALRSIVQVYTPAANIVRDNFQKDCKDGISPTDAQWNWGDSVRLDETFGFDNKVTNKTGAGSSTPDGAAYNFGQSLAFDNAANAYLNAVSKNVLNGVDEPSTPTLTTGFGGRTEAIYTSENAPNLVYRLRFTFWLEGFDADCFDAIMGQTLSIGLSFTTERS